MRAHLIKAGLLAAVIVLPDGLMPGTSIPAAFVVLSRENKQVKLVDASDLGEYIRGRRKLNKADIEEIVERYMHDSNHSLNVSFAELKENRWNLLPNRYISAVEVKGGVPITELVVNISRGFGKAVKERIRDEKTPYRYLMMKDVGEGDGLRALPSQI